MHEWEKEELRAKVLQAKTIAIPEDGKKESSRVSVVDVIERKVWFPLAGIYRIYDAEEMVYVGRTAKPLRSVLYNTVQHGLSWATGDWKSMMVTVAREFGDYKADRFRVWADVTRHRPRYNKLYRQKDKVSA